MPFWTLSEGILSPPGSDDSHQLSLSPAFFQWPTDANNSLLWPLLVLDLHLCYGFSCPPCSPLKPPKELSKLCVTVVHGLLPIQHYSKCCCLLLGVAFSPRILLWSANEAHRRSWEPTIIAQKENLIPWIVLTVYLEEHRKGNKKASGRGHGEHSSWHKSPRVRKKVHLPLPLSPSAQNTQLRNCDLNIHNSKYEILLRIPLHNAFCDNICDSKC